MHLLQASFPCFNLQFSPCWCLLYWYLNGIFHIWKEWQAQQREKTKEWHAYRDKEEEKENIKMDEYREIGMRLKGYPEEEVRKAKILVSNFIRAAEEVEEVNWYS